MFARSLHIFFIAAAAAIVSITLIVGLMMSHTEVVSYRPAVERAFLMKDWAVIKEIAPPDGTIDRSTFAPVTLRAGESLGIVKYESVSMAWDSRGRFNQAITCLDKNANTFTFEVKIGASVDASTAESYLRRSGVRTHRSDASTMYGQDLFVVLNSMGKMFVMHGLCERTAQMEVKNDTARLVPLMDEIRPTVARELAKFGVILDSLDWAKTP